MREEAVKAYRIPVEAPIDLIEAYFEVKGKALREVLDHASPYPLGSFGLPRPSEIA